MILLTGGTGFIGSELLSRLPADKVIIASRNLLKDKPNFKSLYFDMGMTSYKFLETERIETVIHMAALAHSSAFSDDDYHNINYLSTMRFAQAAAASGVKRFIFLSSIGVNGFSSKDAFKSTDKVKPYDGYSRSKYKAEIALQKISCDTGLEVVIIRPPLVYGKNAPGNFGKLLSLSKRNIPLPFGAIHNKRSFIGVDNLVDFIVTCISHPYAAGNTFLVSDDNDISTSYMIHSLITAAGNKPLLIPVNVSLLRFFAGFVGKASVVDKLTCNLHIDMGNVKKTLGWNPPVSFHEGIKKCLAD